MAERIKKDDIIKSLLDNAFFKSTGATSLSDIAGKLNIKKASLYNHFDGRDAIVEATVQNCNDYLLAINFIPQDIENVTTKYSPETVLKGIVNRYIKMHEKSPLFQIYTFAESQKYFDPRAAQIIKKENDRLVEQTESVLSLLLEKGKINCSKDSIHSYAVIFISAIKNQLELYLLERKKTVMENPDSGEGELFELPKTNSAILDKINDYIDEFTNLLK